MRLGQLDMGQDWFRFFILISYAVLFGCLPPGQEEKKDTYCVLPLKHVWTTPSLCQAFLFGYTELYQDFLVIPLACLYSLSVLSLS